MNAALLNKVCQYLAANGVKCENTDSFKTAVVALVVKTLVDSGMGVESAIDTVMGDGVYQQIADSAWECMQAASK